MFKIKITNLVTKGESKFTFHREPEFNSFMEHYWHEIMMTPNKHYRPDGKAWIVYTSKQDLERIEIAIK